MRISEIITEKTSHAMDINVISSFVANYIKSAWLPTAKEEVESGKSLTDGPYNHVEKRILSGKPLPTDKRDFSAYTFGIGGIDSMVPRDRIKSEDMLMVLPRIYVYLTPDVTGGRIHLPDEENDDFAITLNPNQVISKNGEFKVGEAASILAHEIRHALDHFLSNGKAKFYHPTSDAGSDDFSNETSPYYTNPTEANARFAQVENRLVNKLRKEKNNNEYTKEKYITDVKKHFEDLHISRGDLRFTDSEKQYRRFINRALELFREFKG